MNTGPILMARQFRRVPTEIPPRYGGHYDDVGAQVFPDWNGILDSLERLLMEPDT